ncbi:ribonuclease R [Desulfovibrio ferrophilus]|uniref:Ribonuclease R n=1 Tax=Desulfovibrio ferrophilus TaxID=241368 RepID=A0A2Z6B0C6_9BACT|nr:ribonuclease R [Desulfovibrio ferrophilus]BBD08987.1 ribonuclease R [Desulfovibrio ferrophilus]
MANKKKVKNKPDRGPVDAKGVLRALKEAKRPMRRNEILHALGAYKKDKRDLKAALKVLMDDGKIIRTRGGSFGLTESMSLVTGELQVQRSGVGFVLPEDQRRKDIFINRRNFGDAWNGDKVVVAMMPAPRSKGRDMNPEGRVVRVLERKNKRLPVRIERKLGPDLYLSRPTDPRLDFNVMTDTAHMETRPKDGELLYVEPGDKLDNKLWAATATEVLGNEEDVSVQEKLVKAAHGVPTIFPNDALHEAQRLPAQPNPADFEGRKDLRELALVTIDGAKARDFDDAVHVRREGNGWRLTVAIADVSHYVRPGSALDLEAQKRGNSYYFPQSVEPMFPEALSNGLCSLNPDVPRLAMVAEISFSADGQPRDEEFYAAVIKSHKRLTYMQVHRALEQNDPKEHEFIGPELMPMLREAEALARVLNGVRSSRGSLDFDLPEPEIHFNLLGETTDIRPRPRNFAHQIIEEFMVAANESVARRLTVLDLPCPYRIHPKPDSEKLAGVFKLLARAGITPQSPPKGTITPADLQDLLGVAEGTDLEFMAGRLVLRSMMQAVYSPSNEGHFGLASECYAHFTSPIRRYADLLVHRSMKKALKMHSEPLPKPETLSKICESISARERVAMKAEREILKRLTILFLADKVGEEFTGVVNGVAEYGFWVELNEVMAEGMVRLSTLSDDYYHYLPERQEIVGERTARRFHLGQTVKVKLFSVNLARLEVDLELLT